MNQLTPDFLNIYTEIYKEIKHIDYIPMGSDRKVFIEYKGKIDVLRCAIRLFLLDDQNDDPRLEREGHTLTIFSFCSNHYMELANDKIRYGNREQSLSKNPQNICLGMMTYGEQLELAGEFLSGNINLPPETQSSLFRRLKCEVDEMTKIFDKEPKKNTTRLHMVLSLGQGERVVKALEKKINFNQEQVPF